MMRILAALSLLCLTFSAAGDRKHSWSPAAMKVFGDIEVQDGQQVGNVRSVNGNVRLENNSEVGKASTVNGEIRIDDSVKARHLSTVNGGIRAGEGLVVEQDVKTVNGDIRLKANSRIGESVATVNGSIQLTGTTVGYDVETVNGDIELRHSIVEGDILFREKRRHGNDLQPKLVIDAQSEVRGRIILRQKVRLEIEEGARVGEIIQDS